MKNIQLKFSHLVWTIAVGLPVLLSSCQNLETDAENTTQRVGVEETESAAEAHTDEESNEVELNPVQYQTAGIALGKVEKRALSGTLKVNGLLDAPPQNMVSITALMGGFVKNTELLQGMYVKKGQVIAVLQHPDYVQLQQEYLESRSRLEYQEAEYERQQELSRQNVNAQKTLQQAKANYLGTQAQVSGLKVRLRMINVNMKMLEQGTIQETITLYAPISGYVTQVNTNIGAYVTPTDVLFEIVDTGHLHVEITVFEKDVSRLRIGQKVRYTLSNTEKQGRATIYLIGREISEERTVRVHCHFEQENKELLPGMYLSALIETGSQQVPALPEEAVVNFEGKFYIFVPVAAQESHEPFGKAKPAHHFTMIETGIGKAEDGYTEVMLPTGFDAATTPVVVKGAYTLLSAMKNSEEAGHAH